MIPSLLQIPSAVSDSKLHSVLPNNGKGDFTFDRSTGATRINKDGLIEEVGYFSSELVQNGNFSELGSDVVLNGNFDNGSTNWTLIGDASIGNGVCTFFDTGSNTNSQLISQTGILANKTYKLVFDVTRYVSGRIQLIFGGGSAVNVDISGGVGTYTVYVVNGSSTTWLIKRNGSYPNFDFDIDNISVKQVDPNDRWTLGTGYTYGDGVVNSSSSDGNFLTSSATLVVGKSYKISFDVTRTSGELRHYNGGFTGITANATGTFSGVFTPTETILRFYSSAFVGSVDNVSVVEVQGDRPRLSYDITNGVVEDKPHLLLEPSSTNLLTQSNGFDNWTSSNLTLTSGQSSAITELDEAWLFTATGAAANVTVSVSSSGANTLSVFAKAGTQDAIFIRFSGSSNPRAFFNLSNGTIIGSSGITSSNVEAFKDGWYRISITGTDTVTDARIYVADSTENFPSSGNIYVQNAQLEQQSYATSYIKTAGTVISRSSETCNNSKPSINSTEGVLYCEIKALANDLTYRAIYINDNDATRYIGLRFSNNSNQLQAICYDGANLGFVSTTLSDITNTHKIALQYQSSGISLYVNGGLVGSDATFTGIAANQLDEVLFDSNSGTQGFYGKCKGLAVYNEALSESQLMQLTGVTASSIYNNFVTRTASFTVEALNEVKKVIDNL